MPQLSLFSAVKGGIHGHDPDHHDDGEAGELNVLAIVGIFVVLLLSLAGSFTPRMIAFCQKRATGSTDLESWWIFALMNGLAGGLILGVGWVHSLTDSYLSFAFAFEEPANPAQEYAWAGFIAMMGSLMAYAVDEVVHSYLYHSHPHSHHKGAPERSEMALNPLNSPDVEKASNGDAPHDQDNEHDREHDHYRTAFSKMLILLSGLSFHSFFIGVSLGVGVNEIGLFIAIVVHQYFEGVALGGRIMRLEKESGRSKWYYDILFALACPIGIAIGIGIQASLAFDFIPYAIVNGVFQGMSAGILIYVALVHIVSGGHHDAPHDDSRHKLSHKFATYVGVLLGAAIMAVIGIWA